MIKTGDLKIDWTSFMACSDEKKVVWKENGTETVIGKTTEQVMIDMERNLLHRKQELIFADPNKANRSVRLSIRGSNFEPISCRDKGIKEVLIQYDTNEISVMVEEAGIQEVYKHGIENGVFDLFSVELLLRLLPLDVGYQNELRAFIHMVNDTKPVIIEVISLDKVSDGLKDVDAWQVKVYLGENLQTYWISTEKKELLKQSIQIAEGVFFDFVR